MSGDLGGLCVLGNPKELWSAFKTPILDVAGGCLGTHWRAKKNFVSQGTLDTIAQTESQGQTEWQSGAVKGAEA